MMGGTVWSVSCLLFFYSRCHPCTAICKRGGHVPPVRPCLMESAPLAVWNTELPLSWKFSKPGNVREFG